MRQHEFVIIKPELACWGSDEIVWEIWLPVKYYHDVKPYIEFESASCHIGCDDDFVKLEQTIEVAEGILRDSNSPWYGYPLKVVDFSTFTDPMDLDDSIKACLIMKYRSLELPDAVPLF